VANYERLLRVAKGDESADVVIRNGHLLNVLTRDVYPATVGICEDTIAYVTTPDDPLCPAHDVLDAKGMWLAPGLIDSHMHIESTHVTPEHFANAVLPLGVTTVAADPHEIANVLGMAGVDYMRRASRGLALRVLFFAPTCVPAVPGLETSGAVFTAADVEALLDDPDTIGLAEVMDYWGVIRQAPRITQIVAAGRKRDVILTGHIRGLGGRELNTYLAAGINSDHEFLSPEGILARSRLGMTVEIRCLAHGDNIAEAVQCWRQRGRLDEVVFVTDDIPPQELVAEGHLDRGVRRAITLGMSPVDAIRAATLIPARRLRRHDLGAIAPGYKADILILRDLLSFEVHSTLCAGQTVAREGKMLQPQHERYPAPPEALASVHLAPPSADDLVLAYPGKAVHARVLLERGRQVEVRDIPIRDGQVAWEEQGDLSLAMVWHRHGRNANRSSALIAGTGLRRGAVATTYAHDSHNLLALGRDHRDMAAAVRALIEVGGGYVAVANGEVIALAALPVAGILAQKPVAELAVEFDAFVRAVADLGIAENPMGLLTSITLPVVPRYRLTDMGLADVERQAIVPVFAPVE
jgi:adenine deaminase